MLRIDELFDKVLFELFFDKAFILRLYRNFVWTYIKEYFIFNTAIYSRQRSIKHDRDEIFDKNTDHRSAWRKKNKPYRRPMESFASRQIGDNIVQVVTNSRLSR